MQRRSLVVVLVGAVIVGAVVGFMVVRDASNANDEIYAYRSEISDIQSQASRALPPSQLKVLAIRLDDIRTELSYIPSNHRIASWFSNIQGNASDAMNDAVSAAIPINKRLD
jgi:predicted PurR-regulated permease PerM